MGMDNAQQPSPEKHTEIGALKYNLNKILSDRICRAFTFAKQKYFEFGDESHKLLVRQLRKIEKYRAIHKVKSGEGIALTSHKDINDLLKQFYETLYTPEHNASPTTAQSFLDGCKLPS